MAALPPLHVRQQLLHQPCQTKEVCVKDLLHGCNALALQRSDHANASIIYCNRRYFHHYCTCLLDTLNSPQMYLQHKDVKGRRQTKDIHSSVREAVDTVSDGFFAAGIQLFNFQSFIQGVTCRFLQGLPFAQIPHGGNHWLRDKQWAVRRCAYFCASSPLPLMLRRVSDSPLNRLNSSLARRAATAKPMPEEHPVTSTLLVPMATSGLRVQEDPNYQSETKRILNHTHYSSVQQILNSRIRPLSFSHVDFDVLLWFEI